MRDLTNFSLFFSSSKMLIELLNIHIYVYNKNKQSIFTKKYKDHQAKRKQTNKFDYLDEKNGFDKKSKYYD